MTDKQIVRTWTELAAALGTTPRSLERWRTTFAKEEPPRAENGMHSVAAWLAFMEARGLGHCSPRMNAPLPPPLQAQPQPRQPQAASDSHRSQDQAPAFSGCGWNSRANVLREIMQFLHKANADGQLALLDYAEAGTKTIHLLCDLAKAWEVPVSEFDSHGMRLTWFEILRTKTLHLKSATGN